jgi:hypothetical protein
MFSSYVASPTVWALGTACQIDNPAGNRYTRAYLGHLQSLPGIYRMHRGNAVGHVRERAASRPTASRVTRDGQLHRRPTERRREAVSIDTVQHRGRRDQRAVLPGRRRDAAGACGQDNCTGPRHVYAGDAWRAQESREDARRVGG